MSNCDICNRELTGLGSQSVANTDFRRIVASGFNPFKENILLPTGFRLADLGAAFGLSVDAQYQNWKANVQSNTTSWVLCPSCHRLAIAHKVR